MKFLQELLKLNESDDKKKKKSKKDKSADIYTNYVAGNTIMRNVCGGELSGTKKTSTPPTI